LDGTDKQLKDFASTIQDKLNFGDKAKELREFAAAEKQLNDVYKEKKTLQRATMDADNEIIKQREKLATLDTESAKELAKIKAQINAKNKELRESAKVEADLIKLQEEEIGTLEKLEMENRKLRQERKSLNLETEIGKQRLKEINEQLDFNNDFIKANSDQLKAQKLNVGNYKDSVKEAVNELGLFSREIAILNKGKKVATLLFKRNTKEAKDSAEGFKQAGLSVRGLGQGFRFLGKMIIASGIGVLVFLLGSLVTALTTTTEGMDTLRKVFIPLKVVFETFVGFLQKVGLKVIRGIKDAFNDPKQAIKDFGQLLIDQVINRFKAVAKFAEGMWKILKGEFKEGSKMISDASLQMVTGVEDVGDKLRDMGKNMKQATKDAWALGKQIERLGRELKELEIAQTVPLAKMNLEYEKALELSRDQTATTRQRIDAFNEAERIQREMNRIKARELKMELELLELKTQSNDTSREQLLEIEQKKAEILQQEASLQRTINGIVRQRSGLLKSIAEQEFNNQMARQRLTELELSLQIEREQRRLQEMQRERVHFSELIAQRRIIAQMEQALAEQRYRNDVKQAKGNKVELEAIEMKRLRELEKLHENYNDFVLEVEKNRIKLGELSKEEQFQKEVELLDKQSKQRQLINLRTIKDDEELAVSELEIERQLLEDKIELRKKYFGEATELEIELAKLTREKNEQELNQMYKQLDDFASGIETVFNQMANNAMESFRRQEQGAQMMYGTFEKLAVEGNITAQQSMAEMQERIEAQQRKQMQMEQRKLRMQQAQQVSSILLNQLEQGKTPGEALASAGAFLATSKTLLASLPSYGVGIESTPDFGGRGIDGKGGFLAINHPKERIFKEKENEKIGNLSNPMVADIAYKYRTGQLSDSAGNSYDLMRLEGKLSAIEQAIQSQPQQVVGLEETLSGMVEMMVKNIKGNHTRTTIYKS
jgi:hypothetical protein